MTSNGPVFALAALLGDPPALGVDALELCLLLEQLPLLQLEAIALRLFDAHLVTYFHIEGYNRSHWSSIIIEDIRD